MTKNQQGRQGGIVVAGDVCLDVLTAPINAQRKKGDPCENWRLSGGNRTFHLPGGAMLLTRFVACATGQTVAGPVFRSPPALISAAGDSSPLPDSLLERLTPQDMVHSLLALCSEAVGKGKDEHQEWRVSKTLGYAGPDEGDPRSLLELPGDRPDMDLVVLDDTGNGFRQNKAGWPQSLGAGRQPSCIVHKLHRPLPSSAGPADGTCGNPLWDTIQTNHKDRAIVIVDINDLRGEGAAVSRGLSWEKTALELLWHLRGDTRFAALRDCRHLVVRFGLDGALCYHNFGLDRFPEVRLIYAPKGVEDSFLGERKAGMVGLGSSFAAWLAADLLSKGLGVWPKEENAREEQVNMLSAAVRVGLAAARRLYQTGFGSALPPAYPGCECFTKLEEDAERFANVSVPIFAQAGEPDPQGWTLLDAALPPGSKLESVSEKILRQDKVRELDTVPLGVFKKLRTYDRYEIEAYRSICTIMREYLENPAPKRPLSIAVFGPPGSGKSFGVQQVAEYIKGDVEIDMLPAFNLSQFRSVDELTSAFHIVRDSSVKKRVPLVFFDEFDAAMGAEKLFWLKHFLAPMQDGVFMDHGVMHPIGKAIFIFAGGIFSRFEDFAVGPDAPKREGAFTFQEFKNVKGPDFVSRLRARLDIIGVEHSGLPSAAALLRRASILRFQLKEKAPEAFDSGGELQIDDGLARALLQVPKYHHGVRSMEAILDMSRLSGCKRLGPACLPPPAQMALHVDADQFNRLVFSPATFDLADLDKIARAIHEDYLAQRKKDGTYKPDKKSHQVWDKLIDKYVESNRDQARMIPIRLRTVSLCIRKPTQAPPTITNLTDDQVELLARQEHERWLSEALRDGGTYGPTLNDDLRIHPCLIPWSDSRLSEAEKDKDRHTIRKIPEFLATAGYEIA